jgi:hypothetical protein
VVPEHKDDVPLIAPGTAGAVFIVKAKLAALEVPHVFVAVTEIFPEVEPIVTVAEVVPCPDVIVAPAGTVQT